jgi:hypothetical protein
MSTAQLEPPELDVLPVEDDAPAVGPEPPAALRPAGPLAVGLCLLALVLAALAQLEALNATALSADAGIQYHLATLAGDGQLPVRDFEHGWNVLSWWMQSGLQWLSAGSPTAWAFLWEVVTALFLVGVLFVVIGRRHGLSAPWLLGLTAATLVVSFVPHGKYALPALWLLALQPVGRLDRPLPSVAVRFVAAGVLVLAHVDLAVMLCAGTALYDVVGARGLRIRVRVARVAALAAGLVVAFGAELVAFAALGVPPQEVVDFLVVERATSGNPDTAFFWDLLHAPNVHGAVYPATLLVPFVPAIWNRLSGTTRLTAALHVSLALVAIRKMGEMHIGSASVLLALLGVLGAYDLHRSGSLTGLPRPPRLLTLPLAAVGVAWVVGTTLFAFRAGSVVVLASLCALAALGPLAAWRGRDLPAVSLGALVAAAGLAATCVWSLSTDELRGEQDGLWDRTVAQAIGADVERCLGDDRRAWVTPEPLGLYRLLELENPTPYFLFWPGFAVEEPDVLARIERREIPAVVQVGPWMTSMLDGMAPAIESTYTLCGEVMVPEDGVTGIPPRNVRIWVDERPAVTG